MLKDSLVISTNVQIKALADANCSVRCDQTPAIGISRLVFRDFCLVFFLILSNESTDLFQGRIKYKL